MSSHLRRCTGRDDQRIRRHRAAAGERNRERPLLEIDARDVALHDLAAKTFGLRAHLGHQVRTHDAVAEPRPVLDHRGQHQLPTGLEPLDEQRRQIRSCRIERRRETGRSRPDDDDSSDRPSQAPRWRSIILRDVFLAAQSDDGLGQLAFLEEQQRRNTANGIPLRDGGILVHVQLRNRRAAVELRGQRIDGRGQPPAGTAPLRPEVHEHDSAASSHHRSCRQ